jgi:hypothetical protein
MSCDKENEYPNAIFEFDSQSEKNDSPQVMNKTL